MCRATAVMSKEKRIKEKQREKNVLVKHNHSSGNRPFDYAKRKTKKMADMLDFLERERNVSILNDICRSFDFRKEFKRNTSSWDEQSYFSSYSQLPSPISSESEELNTFNIDSLSECRNQGDISQLYPNVIACEEEIKVKSEPESNTDTSNPMTTSLKENTCLVSPHTSEARPNDGHQFLDYSIKYEENDVPKQRPPTTIKNEEKANNNSTYVYKEKESPVLNLQISSIKRSTWIDPDAYTSDESVLVIDESIDTHNTHLNGREDENLSKTTMNQGNDSSEGQNSIDATKTNHASRPKTQPTSSSGHISEPSEVTMCDKEDRKEASYIGKSYLRIESPPLSEEVKISKEINQITNPDHSYIIKAQEEVNQSVKYCQNCSLEETPLIQKIKFKKVDRKEGNCICDANYVSSSSSNKMTCTENLELKYHNNNDHASKENDIIDVESYVESEKETSKNKHLENIMSKKSPQTIVDESEQIVSSSDIDFCDSLKTCPSLISAHQQQKGTQYNEFTVLRKHLENRESCRRYTTMPRDPMTIKNCFSRPEPYNIKLRNNDSNIFHGNLESETILYMPDLDIVSQNALGEFNEVVRVMYRELLTPLPQKTIGQLTEILYLVISESVRYSDRCRKANQLILAERVIREQVSAHRDFQANTIFYGMYFTHLFRNVVQCFPTTKEFHTFMYLALFVNLFRTLKSVYNVHSSYLHIARKLFVSMLKANMYDDIVVFTAVCKPDPVFETDFILVSQLIDSFIEYSESPKEPDYLIRETNYLSNVSLYNKDLQSSRTSTEPSRNLIHQECPRITVAPMSYLPSQYTQPQSHSNSHQTNSLQKEEPHIHYLRTLPKPMKHTSYRDPRANASSYDLKSKTSGQTRPPFFLVAEPNPVSRATHPQLSTSSLPFLNVATSSLSGPTTTSPIMTTSLSPPASVVSSISGIPRNTQSKSSAVTSSGHGRCPSPGFHLWRPTAVHPRFRPSLPVYPQASLF